MSEELNPEPSKGVKHHVKKHKKKYQVGGALVVLLAALLELLPPLKELIKLKIEQSIEKVQNAKDAGN